MDFHGTKKDGKAIFPPAIAEERRRYWEKIKDGAAFKESLTVPRNPKTQLQLGSIWGLMLSQAAGELNDRGYDTSFIYNLPDPTGIPIDKDDLCDYFYNACPIRNESGERITLSKADTKQAAVFFDKCRNYMASQWGIIIPDPDPNWKNKP